MPTSVFQPVVDADDGIGDDRPYFDAVGDIVYLGHYLAGNTTETAFFRFPSITIPAGATVSAATITFTCIATAGPAQAIDIYGNDIDNAVAPTSYAEIIALDLTAAKIDWDGETWTVGNQYVTPDITTIIQEILSRQGWASGNAIMVLFKNMVDAAGNVRAVSCEAGGYSSANWASLSITYVIQGELLRIHTGGPQGSQVFVDSSTGGANSPHDITVNNDPHHTNIQARGNFSVYFDGTDDYLQLASDIDFAMGTVGTIHFWMFASADANQRDLLFKIAGITIGEIFISLGFSDATDWNTAGGYIGVHVYYDGAVWNLQFASTVDVADGAWHHIAVVWAGGTYKLFIDGVLDNQGNLSRVHEQEGILIGGETGGDRNYTGYLEEIVLDGSALWDENFTPPEPPSTQTPASNNGSICKVTIGGNTVTGIGTWIMSGISAEAVDNAEFLEELKLFQMGQKDGGMVIFSGLLKPGGAGQHTVLQHLVDGDNFTDLKCYIDNTSYYAPCLTSGYLSPASTSGNPTPLSHVAVQAIDINTDQSGLISVSFAAKVSGLMVLV